MKLHRIGLCAVLCLGLGACRVAPPRGFHLDLTDFDQADQVVDDLIVWPIVDRGTGLEPALLTRMTRELHRGMRDRDYSVLSNAYIHKMAEQLGPAEGAALRALEQTEADGVLVVKLTRWDEHGLLNVGKIRAEGQLKLLGKNGRVRWQGRINCDAELVDRLTGPRKLEERRKVVIDRLAELLAARLPRHRV